MSSPSPGRPRAEPHICRGEYCREDGSTGRQLNQILHFRTDGTFLGQFGLPQTPGTLPLAPGAGNNLKVLGVVEVDGVIYVYNPEENYRGLHRWKLTKD